MKPLSKRFQARRSARGVLRAALEAGAVVKPARCQACGEQAEVMAHQPAPAEPLVVFWGCAECLAKLRRPARADAAIRALARELIKEARG